MKLAETAKREFEELDQLLFSGDYEAYRDKCIALGIGERNMKSKGKAMMEKKMPGMPMMEKKMPMMKMKKAKAKKK